MTEELPAGWVRVELGSIADTQLGKMLDKGKSAGHEHVPYLRNKNVQWGHIDLDDIFDMEMSKEDAAFYSVKRGDLLVCEGGEVGRCAVWEHHEHIAFQKALHRVRPSEAVTAGYLRYFVEHVTLRGWLNGLTTGSTIKHLPQEQLRKLQILLPPLAEQRRIAAALDEHLSRLDEAARVLSISRKKLAAWEASYLLASTVDHPIAERWTTASIGSLAKVSTGATPSRSRSDYYDGGTIPWVTSSLLNEPYVDHTKTFITDKALHETAVKKFPAGTLLMAMYGEGKTRGRCSELRIEATTNQACAAIQLREQYQELSPWVKVVLEATYDRNRRRASGGVQPNLNLGMVREIEIPIPPSREQRTILAEVDRQRSLGKALSNQLEATASRTESLRRSLLGAAFSGMLVPQDANDESASVLLERIRSERTATESRKRSTPRALRGSAQRQAPATIHPVPAGIQEELPL